MAIIYLDRFATVLTAGVLAGDALLPVSEAARDEAVGQLPFDWSYSAWGGLPGQCVMRVPMFLDDGVNVERVMVPFPPPAMGDPWPVERGPLYAQFDFGSGAALRASPSAAHVAQGFAGQQFVAAGEALVIPGETVVVEMPATGDPVVLRLPEESTGGQHEYPGESWPATVLLKKSWAGDVAINFVNYAGTARNVAIVGGAVASTVTFPAARECARLVFQRLPRQWISGYVSWFVTVEFIL